MQKKTAEGVIFATGGGTIGLTVFDIPVSDWASLMAILSMAVALGFRIAQFIKESRKQ